MIPCPKKQNIKNQLICIDQTTGIEVWIKPLDKIAPHAVGNKYFKLKYNFKEARTLGHNTLLTFGGAYSNHIAATAELGAQNGFQTIGLIRGDELGRTRSQTLKENSTLAFAHRCGMRLEFISRKAYREKHTAVFKNKLVEKFGYNYRIPEGGTNKLAVQGCREILGPRDKEFDVLACPVGTGGTLAGIVNASEPDQFVFGFSALNADLHDQVARYTLKRDWRVLRETHFGGFAKINKELVSFINRFYDDHGILLDPIYTGKMMFDLFKKIKAGFFPKNTRILGIHTGGLQGIAGINQKLSKKGLPTIEYKNEI